MDQLHSLVSAEQRLGVAFALPLEFNALQGIFDNGVLGIFPPKKTKIAVNQATRSL